MIQEGFGVCTSFSTKLSDHQRLRSLSSGSFLPDDGIDDFVRAFPS